MTTSSSPEPEFFSAKISSARRFCLALEPGTEERLTVGSGGCEHCAPDYEINRPGFPYWVIEFVAQGQGTLTLAGESYQLVAGTIFAYGPEIAHQIVTHPQATLVKYFVDFGGHEAQELLGRYGPTPGRVVQTSAPSDVLHIFDELVRTGLRGTALTSRVAAVVLEHLILRISETSVPFAAAHSPAFSTYRRCRQYIEEHWAELSSLEQAARECSVDPAYICRLFRRFDQQTPYQFLLRQKMSHAATRLLRPNASVKQVADELGFADQFHFSRVFRRVLGLSPGQFARLHQRT